MAGSVATRAVEVIHDTEPKKVIWNKLNAVSEVSRDTLGGLKWIDRITPTAGDVLIAVYQRPEKTKGGILMPETSSRRTEDMFQGTVGLIVKTGPNYEKHAEALGFDEMPPINTWVAFRTQDCTAFVLDDQPMRLMQGNFIRMILKDSDCII